MLSLTTSQSRRIKTKIKKGKSSGIDLTEQAKHRIGTMSFRSIFDAGEIRSEFENAGISCKFIPLIWKYAIQNPNGEWEEVPSLPSAAYILLRSKFKPLTSTLHSATDSSDGLTTKLLIKLKVYYYLILIMCRTPGV